MKNLEKETKIKVQNNIIKSIAMSELNKNIIFEGGYALYKILRSNSNDDFVSDRVLNITDLDIDTFNVIDELWGDNQNNKELHNIIYKFINNKITPIFENKYFHDVVLKNDTFEISKHEFTNSVAYSVPFTLGITNNDDGSYFIIKVDLFFIKEPYPYYQKTIKIDDEYYDVMVYEIEKYYVGKLFSLLKHYNIFLSKYANKKKDNYHTYGKLIKTFKDIDYIKRFFPLDHAKMLNYITNLNTTNYSPEDLTFKFKEIYDKVKNGYKR